MKAVLGKRMAILAEDKGWRLEHGRAGRPRPALIAPEGGMHMQRPWFCTFLLLSARDSLAPQFGGKVGGPGRIRPTVRMAHDRKLLAPKQFEFSALQLNECGRMVGGWLKTAKSGTGLPQP